MCYNKTISKMLLRLEHICIHYTLNHLECSLSLEHICICYMHYTLNHLECSLSLEHICICYMHYTLNHLECSLSLEHICTLLYALYSEPSRMTSILLIRSLIVICSSSFSSRNFATSKNASSLSRSSGRPSFTF